jgi:hypothetical protein
MVKVQLTFKNYLELYKDFTMKTMTLSTFLLIFSFLSSWNGLASDTSATPGFTMMPASMDGGQRRENFRKKFLERQHKDSELFTASQLKEIEDLYQIANSNPRTPGAKENLLKIISTKEWKEANRTGCALLYLATTFSEKEEMENYLKTAIAEHSDCWYGDGVEAGAFARYLLGKYYLNSGKKTEAENLFKELREKYPDSIDHVGELLISKIPKKAE